mmetsp:Transcript_15837/g.25079  ORF Transcript_15837/g.25079 Transcript_15837/m.25079 type:complete len:203 (-) Transcript_15837:2979-3587(-)
MDPGVLDVLRDGIVYQLAVHSHCIHLNLLCVSNELGDHHRMLRTEACGFFDVLLKALLFICDVHCGSGKHVAWADKNREADGFSELHGRFQGRHLLPGGLVGSYLIEKLGKPQTIFAIVDRVGARSEDFGSRCTQRERKVVGHLSTNTDDDSGSGFVLINIQDSLKCKLFKIEAVTFVIVGRHRLGVVVYHDGFFPEGPQGS